MQAAVDNGATVLNLSLGGSTDSPVLDDIIQQALARGIMVFAAAGNQPGTMPTYPAAIPGVNAVTALGPGQLASYADYGSFVDMALPGTSVVYLGSQLCGAGNLGLDRLRDRRGGAGNRINCSPLVANSGCDATAISRALEIGAGRRQLADGEFQTPNS